MLPLDPLRQRLQGSHGGARGRRHAVADGRQALLRQWMLLRQPGQAVQCLLVAGVGGCQLGAGICGGRAGLLGTGEAGQGGREKG